MELTVAKRNEEHKRAHTKDVFTSKSRRIREWSEQINARSKQGKHRQLCISTTTGIYGRKVQAIIVVEDSIRLRNMSGRREWGRLSVKINLKLRNKWAFLWCSDFFSRLWSLLKKRDKVSEWVLPLFKKHPHWLWLITGGSKTREKIITGKNLYIGRQRNEKNDFYLLLLLLLEIGWSLFREKWDVSNWLTRIALQSLFVNYFQNHVLTFMFAS